MTGHGTDKVTLEIIKNHLVAVAEGMCHSLERTAHSTFIKESADFAAGIATVDGEIVGYPRYVGVTSFVALNLAETIRAAGPYEPGDIVITNDPYTTMGLATHLPDIHFLKPIFADGELLCFAWCFIHCSDVGGLVPASISPQAYDIHQEGFRVQPRKLYRGGELDRAFIDTFLANTRTPEENWGDFKAMVAALNTAEARAATLVSKFGAERLRGAMSDLADWSEERVRDLIGEIPNGEYSFADYMDHDAEGIPIRLAVTLRVADHDIVLDYTGTDPQVDAAFNVPAFGERHPFLAQGLLNYFLTQDSHIPLTGGIVRPLRNVTTPGSIVNPTFPAAVGVRYATAHRLYNVVLGALAQACADRVPAAGAGQAAMVALSVPRPGVGGRQVAVLQPMFGGGGSTGRCDGVAGADSCAGYLKNTPIESMENTIPVIAERYELLPDSAGAGLHRGGWGTQFAFRVLRPNSIVTARGMERTRFGPWGLAGGRASGLTSTVVNEGRVGERRLGRIDVLRLRPNDTVTIRSSGGGGYGDPLDRDPRLVLADVRSDLLSVENAARHYGVVVTGGGVDEAATERLRGELRQRPDDASLFDLGADRVAYEERWTPEARHELGVRLETLPVALRSFVKNEIHRRVDADESSQPFTVERLDAVWTTTLDQVT
jgi:N-methylhydantoinase B